MSVLRVSETSKPRHASSEALQFKRCSRFAATGISLPNQKPDFKDDAESQAKTFFLFDSGHLEKHFLGNHLPAGPLIFSPSLARNLPSRLLARGATAKLPIVVH